MDFTLSSPYLSDFLSFAQDRSSFFMAMKSQRTCLDFVAGTGPLRNSKGFSTNMEIMIGNQVLRKFFLLLLVLETTYSCPSHRHDFREEGFGVATISAHLRQMDHSKKKADFLE